MPIPVALIGFAPLGLAAVVATVTSHLSTREPKSTGCRPRRELLETVLERVPDAVLLLDESGRVGYANLAARAFGMAPGEDLLASPRVHEEDRDGLRSTWNRLQGRIGQSVSVEIRLRRGDVWSRAVITAENLAERSAAGAVLVTVTDALRRTELEWRLEQARRLEAIGRLAGGVAHDFNNVLTTIQGLTRIILDDRTLSDGTKADVEEIANAADRAANVTRRLLAFSRRQMLRPRVIDLNERVRELQDSIGGLIGADIALNAFTAAREPDVFVDPAQLDQILHSLALNARDAMPSGGLLTVRTDDVTITPEQAASFPYQVRPGRYVLLEVSDTGPGIPAHLRQQVFEPFFTTKASAAASGLGLSTVYGIVKQSGGYVWIGSADGGGARVAIHLPVASEASPEVEAELPTDCLA